MPGYKESLLYAKLKVLRHEALIVLNKIKKDKNTLPNEVRKMQFLSDCFELIHDVCKHFDSQYGLTFSLGLRLGKASKLFDKEEVSRLFGTRKSRTILAIVSKINEHTDYSKEKIRANLQKYKKDIFKAINEDLGPGNPEDMETYFSELLSVIDEMWLPGKENVQILSSALNSDITYQFDIFNPDVAHVVNLVCVSVNDLPNHLVDLLPFFDPKAIELNTESSDSIMVSILKQFLSGIKELSFTHKKDAAHPFLYSLMIKDSDHSVTSQVVNFQDMVEAKRRHWLPIVSEAVAHFKTSGASHATQRELFFSSKSGSVSPSGSPSSREGDSPGSKSPE